MTFPAPLAVPPIVLFVAVHLFMVVAAGVVNEIGSMITGRYRLPPARADKQNDAHSERQT